MGVAREGPTVAVPPGAPLLTPAPGEGDQGISLTQKTTHSGKLVFLRNTSHLSGKGQRLNSAIQSNSGSFEQIPTQKEVEGGRRMQAYIKFTPCEHTEWSRRAALTQLPELDLTDRCRVSRLCSRPARAWKLHFHDAQKTHTCWKKPKSSKR